MNRILAVFLGLHVPVLCIALPAFADEPLGPTASQPPTRTEAPQKPTTLALVPVQIELTQLTSIPVLGGAPPLATESFAPHRHHLIIGATAAPFLTFDVHNGWKPYIGVSLLPELRYAYSLDEVADTPRIFVAARWTAFSTSVPFQKNVAAEPVSELEMMGAIGVSFRISRALETRDRMTTSVGWLSVGVGFGNLKSRTGELITGPSLLLSLDTDGLSFNIGGSR